MNSTKLPYLLLLLGFLAYASLCNSQETPTTSLEKIDSLIEVKKINKHTLQVKYGHDAITAINCNDTLVIIDGGISPTLTFRYKKIIEKEFKTNLYKYLINTHGHYDHYMGNSTFTKAKIVGHQNSLKEIYDQWRDPKMAKSRVAQIIGILTKQLSSAEPGTNDYKDLRSQLTAYQYSYHDINDSIKIRRPEVLFSDSLLLQAGEFHFELFPFGTSHSQSDILIFIPELKLLFTGDLFTRYGRPGNNKNLQFDREKWNLAVKWLNARKNNIGVIVGGHGQIMGMNDLEAFIVKLSEI